MILLYTDNISIAVTWGHLLARTWSRYKKTNTKKQTLLHNTAAAVLQFLFSCNFLSKIKVTSSQLNTELLTLTSLVLEQHLDSFIFMTFDLFLVLILICVCKCFPFCICKISNVSCLYFYVQFDDAFCSVLFNLEIDLYHMHCFTETKFNNKRQIN